MHNYPINSVFKIDGFVSTSFDSNYAKRNYAKADIKIYAKKGQVGIDFNKIIGDNSGYWTEFEYLLPKNSLYKKVGEYYDRNGIYHVNLEIL